eukprot:m51a1_g11418 hypothetical protein (141) ;mRNA; f:10434-15557
MSASSGSDTAGPAAAAHLDAQLRTAWLLRNHVLPCVDDSDKGPLALALPAALAAPCCRAAHEYRCLSNGSRDLWLPSLCSAYLLRELVGACVPQRLCPATCALFVCYLLSMSGLWPKNQDLIGTTLLLHIMKYLRLNPTY